jgi:uncharacterized protein (DUF697 family)
MKLNWNTINAKAKSIFEAVEQSVDTVEDAVRGEIEDDRNERAPVRRVILAYSGAAAAASANPIPFSSFALLTPIHVAMVLHVGKRMGQELTLENAGEILKKITGAVGLSIATRVAAGALLKIGLPGIGGMLRTPVIFGLTYGLGRVAEEYFERKAEGLDFDVAKARAIFEQAVREGRVDGGFAQGVKKKTSAKKPTKKTSAKKPAPKTAAKQEPVKKKKAVKPASKKKTAKKS